MSDPISDAITRAIISKGDELLQERGDGPFDFYQAQAVLPPGKTRDDMIDELAKASDVTREVAAEAYRHGLEDVRIAKSSRYQVAVYEGAPNGFGEPMVHLSIKRLDREPIHDWRDLQKIKNAIVGEEAEAVELYPAESRLVDAANQYHLWCFRPGFKLPLGFDTRLVQDHDDGITGSKQRPFESPDAVLPSRLQLSASLSTLLRFIEQGLTVPDEYRNEARSFVALIEHARQQLPGESLTTMQRLTRAIEFVKRAQEVIDPITIDESMPSQDAEVNSMTRELVVLIDSQLQESRDDLTRIFRDLGDLPEQQS